MFNNRTVGPRLVFNSTFILEIPSLRPEDIKATVKKFGKLPDQSAKHTDILNFVAQSLGFSGGFADYPAHFKELTGFLKMKGLCHLEDLVNNQFSNDFLFKATRQKVSDCLFLSNKKVESIFTGYDYHWEKFLPFFEQANLLISSNHLFSEEEWNRADSEPSYSNLVLDTLFRAAGKDYLHYLKGNLVNFGKDEEFYNQTYFPWDYKHTELEKIKENQRRRGFELFRKDTEKEKQGWVDVLKYNDRLAILVGKNGAFDFLVKNEKDKGSMEFNVRRFWPLDQDFWLESEMDKAEKEFYSNGGTVDFYPSQEQVLTSYGKGQLQRRES